MKNLWKRVAATEHANSHIGSDGVAWNLFWAMLLAWGLSFAQAQTPATTQQPELNATTATGAPSTITLQDALQRARMNDPQFRSAITDAALAREGRVQARAGLLPNVNYNNSFIYTQGTGVPAVAASKFIANNGVHEYISQADVHQSVSLTNFADYRKSSAALAQAKPAAPATPRPVPPSAKVEAAPQAVPGFWDPRRRPERPDLSRISVIRFVIASTSNPDRRSNP